MVAASHNYCPVFDWPAFGGWGRLGNCSIYLYPVLEADKLKMSLFPIPDCN